uniref:Uncharacterized protein n=1 Tax=Anguilla anguilla TaxID=7936 RepID=A0A0E9W7C4_ANGAN
MFYISEKHRFRSRLHSHKQTCIHIIRPQLIN